LGVHGSIVICPVVLAGGASGELWPLSRAAYPKPFVRLNGEHTLLRETVARAAGLAERGAAMRVRGAMVVCHEGHHHLVAAHTGGTDVEVVILEPVSRGTAPALTIAALAAARDEDDPTLLVMPADHVVEDLEAWQDAVLAGAALAREGKIVTFGVVPDRAEVAYGYLRKGARVGARAEGFALSAFIEKPAPDAARSYLSAGKYLWNSGLYMVRASVWIDAISSTQPPIAELCRAAVAAGRRDGAFFRVDERAFARCPAVSIDYGVMEPIVEARERSRDGQPLIAAVVPLDAGWADVGSWPSLLRLRPDDSEGNVLRGDVLARHTTDSVLISTRRLLCAVGVQDLIAVETPDAVLVVHRDHTGDVPALIRQLKEAHRPEAEDHVWVSRPWGDFESLDSRERYQVKRLTVKPGAVLSLQLHHHRAEHWVVVKGTARVTRDDEVFLLTENESTFIPVGMKHRLENPGTVPLEIIEVRSGSYLEEDDIVRFEETADGSGGADA
jgi:mannose-1-phosphate guanylyltransferase / mannose-6-phosphate isomerase